MSLLSSFWNGFIEKLEKSKQNNPVTYPLLKHAHPVELTEKKIVVSVDSQAAQEFLAKRTNEIEASLFSHSQKKLEIDFILKPLSNKKKLYPPLLSFEPSME